MQIRQARDSDLPQLRILYQHLHPADPMLPLAGLRDPWQKILATPNLHCLVLELDHQLVSTCTLILIPNLTRSAKPYAIIENVVTLESHRRRGLGTAILKAALDLAWQHHCYKVTLTTGSKKESTLHFYETAGFSRHDKTAFIARPPQSN